MPNPLFFLVLFLVMTLGGLPGPIGAQTDHPITLDGNLTVEEWQAGADQPVNDEGWARLAHRDDGLYIAVRNNFVAMVDVMVQRGDELHQLHVSGQVGGALFERGDDDLWRLTGTYPWFDEVKTKEAFEAETSDKMSALRKRLAARKKPMPTGGEPPKTPPPAPSTPAPPALPAPSSKKSAPPSPPPFPAPSTQKSAPPSPPPFPVPTPAPSSTPAEDAATIAKHLDEYGWTGTIFNMGAPKTAEIFLSNGFLKPGDRLLVMWQRRIADKTFAIETFPADATPMPEEASAVYSTPPFAHDFANWYVVE